MNQKCVHLFYMISIALMFSMNVAWGSDTQAIHDHGLVTPGMFQGSMDSLIMRGLGGACLGTPHIIDDLPCHPGYVSLAKNPNMTASLVVSEGYEFIDQTRKLAKGGAEAVNAAEVFLDGPQPASVEVLSKVSFISQYLNAQYSPSHLQFYSNIQGDINPSVQLLMLKADSLRLQWGMEVLPWLSVGVQTWSGNAEIIRRDFALLDLGTDAGQDYLKKTKSHFAIVEPGFVLHSSSKKLYLAVLSRNISEGTPVEIADPKVQSTRWGLGFEMLDDIRSGRLTFLVEERDQLPRLGMKYDYGVLSVMAGAHRFAYSYGLLFFIKKMYSGLIFSKVTNENSEVRPSETIYTTFGVQL